jgi:hypothetical protein
MICAFWGNLQRVGFSPKIYFQTMTTKYIYILSIFIIALCLGSCNTLRQASPEEAARQFFTELGELDFETASMYATSNTQKKLRLIHTELKMSSAADQEKIKADYILKVKQLVCADDNGQMRCRACCTQNGGEMVIEMMEKDKKWFVNFPE